MPASQHLLPGTALCASGILLAGVSQLALCLGDSAGCILPWRRRDVTHQAGYQ